MRGVKGWKSAQCTAGGIRLDEIDMQTMESRIVPGFYLVGENPGCTGKMWRLQFAECLGDWYPGGTAFK